MQPRFSVCIAFIAVLCAATPGFAAASPQGSVIDDADPGWTWSGMSPYSNPGLVKSTGHAGGPGGYGVYTFFGTGVEVVVMRSPSIEVDGQFHRCGKLKISIDGHLKTEAAASGNVEFNDIVYSAAGLAPKNHVLQLEPEDGWAVIDCIKVINDPSAPSADGGGPAAQEGILFSSKSTPLAGNDLLEARSNVGGFDNGIGPELQIGTLPGDWGLATIYAHSGNTAIRYSGSSTGTPSYCYMIAYRVDLAVTTDTWLTYWILPQQDNGRFVAVDLHCTDGSALSTSGAIDENGFSVAPAAGHGGAIELYAWTPIRCHAGNWLAGKTIDKIWVGYASTSTVGQYRGYIDDLVIDNEKPAK